MVLPFLITSSSDEDDSISVMSLNDRDDKNNTCNNSVTSDNLSPTSAGGGTVINLVNRNKRQRFTSESPFTEESENEGRQESKKPAKRARITMTIDEPIAAEATAAMMNFPSEATQGSFGVSISNQNDQHGIARPSFEDLSAELCKIVDAAHYSRHEAIAALTNLCQWGYTDDPVFLEEMLELGGIQRVLLYLKNNEGDPACVAMAAKAIMTCTVRSPKHQSFEVSRDIVRALTKREGIEILLQASNECGRESMASQVEALRWIWSALFNITDKSSAYEVGDLEEKKERLLGVFENGVNTMAKLGGNIIAASTAQKGLTSPTVSKGMNDSHVKSVHSSSGNFLSYDVCGGADYQLRAVQWIFSSICGGVGSRKRTAMEMSTNRRKRRIIRPSRTAKAKTKNTTKLKTITENSNSVLASQVMGLVFITLSNINNNNNNLLVREDFEGLNLFGSCIESLKRPNGLEWIGNKDLLIQASQFFVQCCEKNILATKEDFECVLPLIVDCIANFPVSSYKGGLFGFIKKAQVVVDRSMMHESGVLRAIAISLESKDMDNEIKIASRQLLKDIVWEDE